MTILAIHIEHMDLDTEVKETISRAYMTRIRVTQGSKAKKCSLVEPSLFWSTDWEQKLSSP